MRSLFAAALLLACAAASSADAEPAACRAVRLAENGWTDVAATTAVASALYRTIGYAPRVSTQPAPAILRALRDKRADAFLGLWLPTMAGDLKPYLDDGSVTQAGPNLAGAHVGLAAPDYAVEAGLRDVADIARFAPQLGRRILGIEPGGDAAAHVQDLIARNAFGLGGFRLAQASPAATLAELRKAVAARQPVLVLAWSPHWMNRDAKLAYLTGADAVFGADSGAANVFTALRAGWAEQCPNAARLLRNLTFSMAAVDELMEAIRVRRRTPERAAGDWLRANGGALAGWLDGVATWDGKPAEAVARSRLGAGR